MASEDELQSLPDGWSIKTLGELCDAGGGDIQTGPFGSQLHSADYVSAGVPSIMPTNILVEGIQAEGIARISRQDAERLQRYRVRAGDIVYSRRGDVEKCALVTDKEGGWLCGTGCLRVRLGKAPTNSDFVHAYLSSPSVRAWIVRHSIGATMPNLNTGILRSLPVALPPQEEMRSIGAIWTALINKTNQLASMNQELEAIARAIFKSWFVDFDPVRAKADGREPEGMDAATAALFPSEFQESELGAIPKGWSIESIGDLTLRVSMGPFGSNIKTDNFIAEGVPIIRGKNLRDGFIDDDFVFLSDEKADELRNANAFAGDIVITHRGTFQLPTTQL
jgi:type I restriction enzyme S subunit